MATQSPRVLIVDDDRQDQLLSEIAFKKSGLPTQVTVLRSGTELMDYLHRRPPHDDPERSPRPHLILLDLRMAGRDARSVLKELRADPDLKHLPVVVMSNSRDPDDIRDCYRLGANAYVGKPPDFRSLMDTLLAIEAYWFRVAELPEP